MNEATYETNEYEYIREALDKAQKAFVATVDPQAARTERKDAIWSYIHHVSIAVLCEALANHAPDEARQAVAWLESALQDDSAAQWVHEARAAMAAGRRIVLAWDEVEQGGAS